jgi:hypothetical protein
MSRRVIQVAATAVAVAIAVAVAAVPPVVRASPVPTRTTVSCTILEVTGTHSAGGTRLLARTLPADTATELGTLHDPVNAIGAGPTGVYGVDTLGHVVTIERDGREHDLGPPRGADPDRLVGAVAGAVVHTAAGDRWYVRAGARLYQVDVDPASRAYLRVIGAVRLRPSGLAENLDDIDAGPGSGSLYGVAQPNRWHGVLVRVDPLSGEVTPLGSPPWNALPGGSAYGAVSFGPDGALYARQNDIAGRSVRYRIPLPTAHPAVLDSGPAVATSDATGCLPPPPPPPMTTTPPPTIPRPTTTAPRPPTTTTPTTTTPTPTTTVARTTLPTTTVRPLIGPPPTATRPADTPPSTTPPTTVAVIPPSTSTPDQRLPKSVTVPLADVTAERTTQRRWSLTALILIIGGAAAARVRSGRRSGR